MRVWFNRHFSLVAQVIRLLREIDSEMPIKALVSHRLPDFSGFVAADECFLEPEGLSTQEYVQWCLETAVAHQVDWIVPGHEASALAAAEHLFVAKNIRLLNAAEANMMQRLHEKDWVYDNCPSGIPLPRCQIVSDSATLAEAVSTIELDGPACIKPTVSIYGKGFHRITGLGSRVDVDVITVDGWRALYGEVTSMLISTEN